ncbi:MAG: hypothetical protein M3P95_09270 [Actinomycetota bacterium]|nr:hypothetical protein [Actinomycetota bacterium]
MNLGSLLRGVAGGRRGTTGGYGTTGGVGAPGTTAGTGGVGETIGRAVDGQTAGGRGGSARGLGGVLRRFRGGARF